jgi:transmembrane sensor
MSNTIDHIRQLLDKCFNKTATEAELDEVLALLDASEHEEGIVPLLKKDWENPQQVFSGNEVEKLANSILSEIGYQEPVAPGIHKRNYNIRSRWWMAASVILLLTVGTWLWISRNPVSTSKEVSAIPDVPPGHTGAILTLADGRQIVLDSIGNGIIASQEGSSVQLNNGKVIYAPSDIVQGETVYNTMSTPRGRQFQIQLPDGTRAWLNAESSIRFPTNFTGGFRDITITGEVYLEVAKKAAMPFRVNIGKAARIEVLGTSFNVNAYENEATINTTLLNGSVRIVQTGVKDGTMLKPGEQGQIANAPANAATINVLTDVDTDKVMAWKNGAFNFEGLGLREVLRQLERWYDIRVVYKAGTSDLKYRGGMDRNVKFSDILEVFREMGVKYEWDGKTLTIL